MDYCFCTVSSRTRLYQCIALYKSLADRLDGMKLYVLCMDKRTFRILETLKYDNLIPVDLETMENDRLRALKGLRSISEYCWTLKPVFIEKLLKENNDISRITYIDADVFFFSNPKPIFIHGFGKSIWLTPHNYNENIKSVENEVGKYNSGFISFRNNKQGQECLAWWKDRCLEWCYNTTVGGLFGDQKYLDEFEKSFVGVHSLTIPGINVAPWNDGNMVFSNVNGKTLVDGHKLIFYHFCGFKALNRQEFIVKFGNSCNDIIHKPYMVAVRNAMELVESIDHDFEADIHDEADRAQGNFNIFRL